MVNHSINELIKKQESPILEFKREWYWFDEESDEKPNLSKKWGEFIKDIIGLANGYYSYVGKTRYLIIGFDEVEKKIYEVDASKAKILQNINLLRKKVVEKIESFSKPSLTNIEISFKTINNNNLLIFKIPSPPKLIELTKELQTKTRTLDPGVILIRKGQKNDSVRVASKDEIDDLSEEFKEFGINNLQTIKPIIQPIKERSIKRTIKLYINKNESYSISDDYPIIVKKWDEKIIFEAYKISEDFGETKFFVYLHESANQSKTYNYLNSKFIIDNSKTLIVLTEMPTALKNVHKRKDSIKGIFKTKYVYFIEEFGYNFLYKDYISHYEPYNINIFVESFIDSNSINEKTAFEIMNSWYTSISKPLIVVKGYGGIGKTTLVKYFLDHVYEKNKEIGILFIDSNEIINELARLTDSDNKIDDIFDFYEALVNNNNELEKKFSKDLLQLSVDNGNLIIVLDGIDEVIAKLGTKFDIKNFLDSIKTKYSTDLEKSKIIITCRDYFWDSLDKSLDIFTINLKPFNSELAKDFFKQHFPNLDKSVEKSMALSDRLALKQRDDGDQVYIPYILDMIAYLVRHRIEFNDDISLTEINSSILNVDITDDFVVNGMCDREIAKLENLSIDQQITFFVLLAVRKNGCISVYDVKSLLKEADIHQIDNNTIEKLKGHPILSYCKNQLSFRYDFFNGYFKGLYIGIFFNSKNIRLLDNYFIDTIGSYIKFDDSFTKNICLRIDLNDELTIFAIELIENLKNMIKEKKSEIYIIRKAISSIFVMLLTLLRESKKTFNVETCTELLKEIFMEGSNVIIGLNLINLFGYNKVKPIFNFRGLNFNDCYFEMYEYFWECPIDENTTFSQTCFKSLKPRSGIKPKFFRNTFHNSCNIKEIEEIINTRKEERDNKKDNIRTNLIKIFKVFYTRGNFYPKKQEHIKSKSFTNKYLPTLLKNKVILEYVDPEKQTLKQYKISERYQPITKIIEQRGSCIELDSVVNMFVN